MKLDDKNPPLSEWGEISKAYLAQKKEMELSYHDVEDSELEALVEEGTADMSTEEASVELALSDASEELETSDASGEKTDDKAADEKDEADDSLATDSEQEPAADEAGTADVEDDGTGASESDDTDSDEVVIEDVSASELSDEDDSEDVEDFAFAPTRYSNETVIKAGIVSAVALLTLFLAVFSITPLGVKKDIILTGAEHLTVEQVMADSGIKASDYLVTVLVNHSRYEENLKRVNPWVKDVNISYNFPFTFTFDITEEEVVAYGQTVDGLKPILANGLRLTSNGRTSPRGQFITVELDNETELAELAKGLASLTPDIRRMIQFISYETKGARSDLLLLEMTDGHFVRVPLAHLAQKLPYYQKIAPQLTEMSIIDMEVGIYVTTPTIEETKVKSDDTEDSPVLDTLSSPESGEESSELSQ